MAQVRNERAREFNFRQIVGESPAMKKMLALAAKVAESEVSSVLLQGESLSNSNLHFPVDEALQRSLKELADIKLFQATDASEAPSSSR